MENLREQLLINQLMYVAGCHDTQAKQLLHDAKWNLETALSMYFQEPTMTGLRNGNNTHTSCHYKMCTPKNTPATPPNFPDTLMAFAKLSANSPASSAGASLTSGLSPAVGQQQHRVNTTSPIVFGAGQDNANMEIDARQ